MTAFRSFVPEMEERRRARTWLLPWADGPDWWKVPLGLVAVLGLVRSVLLLVSHRPWFMNDSVEYVALVDDLYVPRVHPPGVSVFWRFVLEVWPSLRGVLVAQAVLGVLAGLVLFCIAREVGLRVPFAFGVSVIAGSTPSALFFERVLLAEALAVFLAVVTVWVALVGLRTGSSGTWALAGLVGAIAVLVRTALLPQLLVMAVLACVLTRGSVLPRARVAVAFVLGLAVPLSGYAFATYVDTRAITGEGHLGLQFTDGFAYFAATAPLTDCSRPDEPPAIRARICAIPGYVDRDPDSIAWGPGPVNRALDGPRWIRRNDDLKELARENVRRDPLGALQLAGGRAVRLFSTYDNAYFTDGGLLAPQLEALDLSVPSTAGGFERVWPHVMDAWAIARWILWAGIVLALVCVRRWWSRGGREMLFVVLPPLVTIVWLALTITAVARYLFPYEWVGVLALGWLAQRVTARARPSGDSALAGRPAEVVRQ